MKVGACRGRRRIGGGGGEGGGGGSSSRHIKLYIQKNMYTNGTIRVMTVFYHQKNSKATIGLGAKWEAHAYRERVYTTLPVF